MLIMFRQRRSVTTCVNTNREFNLCHMRSAQLYEAAHCSLHHSYNKDKSANIYRCKLSRLERQLMIPQLLLALQHAQELSCSQGLPVSGAAEPITSIQSEAGHMLRHSDSFLFFAFLFTFPHIPTYPASTVQLADRLYEPRLTNTQIRILFHIDSFGICQPWRLQLRTRSTAFPLR